jgi:hypothetical protein
MQIEYLCWMVTWPINMVSASLKIPRNVPPITLLRITKKYNVCHSMCQDQINSACERQLKKSIYFFNAIPIIPIFLVEYVHQKRSHDRQ